jgi:hypothetical protein
MWFRIAALLGCTVEDVQRRMSSAEFVQWCAFYALEPWGSRADNWRMSVIAATVANYSGNVKKGKAVKPSDFIPRAPLKLSPDDTRKLLEERMRNG